ncbi:MAG: hypothetical protein K2I52_02680 [Muribaculaceae bacterium]|nr:hypothetical protein [Muribaculaceae bacterium]
MSFLHKICENKWALRSLFSSIIFNLKVLPLKQAIKLPILFYRPHFIHIKGKVKIEGPVTPGMIKLGLNRVPIFHNNGLIFENHGIIKFKGKASIGNNSAISVGENGILEIGNNFSATSGLKIVCFNNIRLEEDVLIGWNCMLLDTDFHTIRLPDGNCSKGFGPIFIGHNTWISNGCKIYKNVSIPHHCVVGADTILHKPFESEPYSLICNNRNISIKATNISYNSDNDMIVYPNINDHEA